MREYIVHVSMRMRVVGHDPEEAADRAWDEMTDLGHDVIHVDPGVPA